MDKYTKDDLEKMGQKWLDRIKQAEKREERWIKDAEKAETAYLCRTMGDSMTASIPSFNIIHSNVETIVPAVYNSTPSPDIRPTHNSKDPIARVAADIFERAVSVQIDDNRLDVEIEASSQDAFLAGRGVVRIRFDADEIPAQVAEQEAIGPDGELVVEEVEIAPARLENERVEYECVSWRDYREGPAKRFGDVPWIAFRHFISTKQLEEIEDTEITKQYDDAESEELDVDVWEIWCKDTKTVKFLVEQTCKIVAIRPDPMELDGFFPIAKPVQPITATGDRIPVNPHKIYETLADELDRVTNRINKIMSGLKVRGIIAADAAGIEDLADAEDNQLKPVANIENLVAAGGLDKAIMWWPVDKAIQVLRELYIQRDQTKQAIYEITGISDIIRGQGDAKETATAQQIKTEWGSLRVKKMQRLIERQVRDLFVLTVEVISKHFSHQTLSRITGTPIDQQLAQFLSQPLKQYRIDVESDSTVRSDTTRSRQEMSEFLNGTGQFFATMQPIVQDYPEMAGPLADLYSAFTRQFNLGRQSEDALEQMAEMAKQANGQDKPNPELMKAEAEVKAVQDKAQLEQTKMQLEVEKAREDVKIKQAEVQLKQVELRQAGERLNLDEAKAEVEAAATFAEIDLETEQERPVAVGNG